MCISVFRDVGSTDGLAGLESRDRGGVGEVCGGGAIKGTSAEGPLRLRRVGTMAERLFNML